MNMPTKTQLKVAAAVILSVLIVIVVLQNTETVQTNLLFITIGMPRAVLLFVALVVGFVLGMIATTRFSKKRSEKK